MAHREHSRTAAVLAAGRGTVPEGFVRAYGDVSPGAPRFAGTVLPTTDDPDAAVVADRARRRLAGQGRAPARAAGGRGRPVPRREGRHARRADTVGAHVGPAGDHPAAAAARLSPDHARRARGAARAGQLRAGLLHVFIRHTSASLTLTRTPRPTSATTSRPGSTRPSPRTPATGRTRSKAPTTCRRTSRPPCSARR